MNLVANNFGLDCIKFQQETQLNTSVQIQKTSSMRWKWGCIEKNLYTWLSNFDCREFFILHGYKVVVFFVQKYKKSMEIQYDSLWHVGDNYIVTLMLNDKDVKNYWSQNHGPPSTMSTTHILYTLLWVINSSLA